MSQEFMLPATVWPQMWITGTAVDAGSPFRFDAHDAMLDLDAFTFSRTALEVMVGIGSDYDEIALKAGVVDDWLSENKNATFYVDIDAGDFRKWLETVGLTEEEAVAMDDTALADLRTRLKRNAFGRL